MIDFTLLLKRFLFFKLFVLVSALQVYGQSEVHRTGNLIPLGGINRLEYSNGYTMLSGSSAYQEIGPYTGSCVLTDPTTGTSLDAALAKVNGDVYTSHPDGAGGWYISGNFDAIDTVKIQHVAHIKADKTVDRTWKPNPDNTATAFLVSGSTLYVGGYFNSIGGQTRNYLAAFDITTGNLLPWNPNPNQSVRALQISGTTIYVGGSFTTIGGAARNGLAAINPTTGIATTWAPVVIGSPAVIRSIAVDATTIYIGGSFTVVNGIPRVNVARINLATGALVTAWSANTDGYVNKVKLAGANLYIAGGFTLVNGITRNNLASVTAAAGGLLTWNVGLDAGSWVDDLSIAGTTLYFCGYFETIGVSARDGVAAVDANTATLLPWSPHPNGSVYTVTSSPTNVFFGGYFNGANWINRYEGFILLNDATDEVWPFTFDLNGGEVNTIAVNGNTLYIGGTFVAINKSVRRNLAAFDLTTGALLPWSPQVIGLSATDPDVAVYSMEIKDNLLYIGGKFLTLNTSTRSGLAAIDLTTGLPNNWNPAVGDGKTTDQYVNSIDIVGNTVYAGGAFSLLSGSTPRTNLAAIDASTGAVLPWKPDSKGSIDKIKVSSNAAYVVGDFRNGIGGAVRLYRIAALNLTSDTATPWDPQLRNGQAGDIALGGTEIYVGGSFDSVGVAPRPGLTSFTLATGNITSWNPDVGTNSDGGYDNIITTSPSKLYVAGIFSYLGLENRENFGEYDICPPIPIITSNGTVLSTSSAGTLQWYENGVLIQGANKQTYEINPLEYGVYAVEITANGCTVRSANSEYLITGDETAKGNAFNVYPNPVSGNLSILLPSVSGAVDFTVLDIMGRTVKSVRSNGSEHVIGMHELEAGPYLLMIRTKDQKHVMKIIKIN